MSLIGIASIIMMPLALMAGHPSDFLTAWESQVESLRYLNEPHPRLMILFSGVPGMGKSSVARYLEEAFHGVRFSSDEARRLLNRSNLTREEMGQYLLYAFYELDYHYPNHLLIYDASIDRREQEISFLAHKMGYETFIIRLVLDEEEVKQRLVKREADPEKFLRLLPGWFEDYNRFDLSKVDYFLDRNQVDIDEGLLFLIEKKLASLAID